MTTVRSFAALICVLSITISICAAPPTTRPATAAELEQWWTDLSADDAASVDAVLCFADHPTEAVEFFKSKLRPLNLTVEELEIAVADLANEDEAVWKRAFEKLEYFDPRLAKRLPDILGMTVDPLARVRLIAILGDMPAETYVGQKVDLRSTGSDDAWNFSSGTGSWWAEARLDRMNISPYGTTKKSWTRAIKAITVLRHIGTPGATAILSDMATGHPDAAPTKAAKGEPLTPPRPAS